VGIEKLSSYIIPSEARNLPFVAGSIQRGNSVRFFKQTLKEDHKLFS